MPTTSLGLRYPVLGAAPNVPQDIGNLAADANTELLKLQPSWTTYTPTLTAVSGTPSMGSGGSLTGRSQRVVSTVHVAVRGLFGTGASFGTGAWSISLPVSAAAGSVFRVGAAYLRDASAAGSGHFPAIVVVDPGNPAIASMFNVSAQVGATYPFTWASTDHFSFSMTYEV